MQLHDTIVCQAKMLKKNCVRLQNFEDQTHDTAEALQKYRLCHEEGQKREEELRSELEGVQNEVEKWQRVQLENHKLIERMDIKYKSLRETIASLIEVLGTFHESVKTSEDRVAGLEEIMKMLCEELSSTQKRLSEVEILEEEKG